MLWEAGHEDGTHSARRFRVIISPRLTSVPVLDVSFLLRVSFLVEDLTIWSKVFGPDRVLNKKCVGFTSSVHIPDQVVGN